MSETTTPQPRRRSRGNDSDLERYLIPAAATNVPKRIRELDATARDALARKRAAGEEFKAAWRALERTAPPEVRDKSTGKPPPPAAEKRRYQIAQAAANNALWDLRDAIYDERDADKWPARQQETVASSVAKVEQAAAELNAAVASLAADVGVLRGIDDPREGFSPAPDVMRPRDGRAISPESDELIARVVQTAHEAGSRAGVPPGEAEGDQWAAAARAGAQGGPVGTAQ